jgi:membrane protease YdiL (CAAX protease family)
MNKKQKTNLVIAMLIGAIAGVVIDYYFKIGLTNFIPALICLVLFLRYWRKKKQAIGALLIQIIGLRRPKMRRYDVAFVAMTALGFIVLFVLSFLTAERGASSFSAVAILYALSAMIIPPLLEELPVRGLMQGVLHYIGVRPWAQIVIPALIFGLSHLFVQQEIAYTILIGLLLGFIRYRTGSIYWTLVLHALWNGLYCLGVLLGAK